jgi:peptide deformylase
VSVLDIHVLGSPVLRQPTIPIQAVTAEIRTLIDDMFATMYAARGIGLAAPQVGRRERIAVVDVERNPIVLINPEIVVADGGTQRGEEGCLSIPEIYGDVDRKAHVVVRALDREGQAIEVDGTELLARCMQHEIDHLHGTMFIDHLSFLKRRTALAKWEKEREKYPNAIRKLSAEEIASHHRTDGEL